MQQIFLLALQEPAVLPAATGYTAGEVLTFFAAGGVLITGVGAVIVNIIVALRTGTKIDAAAVKTDNLAAKVEQVHTVTNSGLSAVKAELTLSNALNTQLRDIIADLKSERNSAAVAKALATPVPNTGAAEQLAQIEVNTAETAENTKTPEGR